MAEVSRKCCLLIVLLVSAGWMIEISKVEAFCSEGLGQCGKGNDCQQRCSASHGPHSQGSCDYTIHPPLCTCYYDCPEQPPLPKFCNGSGDLCSHACTDECCSNRCASKFSNGQGYCDDSAGPWLCQCQYPCS